MQPIIALAGLPLEYLSDIPSDVNADFFLKKLLAVKDQNPTPNVDFQEVELKGFIFCYLDEFFC
jgi:hypothetical protein